MTAAELHDWKLRACDALAIRLWGDGYDASMRGESALAQAFLREREAVLAVARRLRKRRPRR